MPAVSKSIGWVGGRGDGILPRCNGPRCVSLRLGCVEAAEVGGEGTLDSRSRSRSTGSAGSGIYLIYLPLP